MITPTTIAAVVTTITSILFSAPPSVDHLLIAIRYKESKGNNRVPGDGGRAIGSYQIHRNYWHDACQYGGVKWSYDKYVFDPEKSEQVARWYMQRYAPQAYRTGNLQVLARLHNGGIGGPFYSGTLGYWRDIQRIMKDGQIYRTSPKDWHKLVIR